VNTGWGAGCACLACLLSLFSDLARAADDGMEGTVAAVAVPLPPVQFRGITDKRQEIDLPTVLKRAREQSLTVLQAKERTKENKANLSETKSEMLPNVKFDAGVGRTLGNISNIGEIPSSRATLFLNPARSYYNAKAAGYMERAGEAELDSVTRESLLTAALQYYDLLRTQALVQIAEQAVQMAQRLVATTDALHQQGLAIRADVLRANTELADRQQRLLEHQRDYRVASIGLATTLHSDPTVMFVPTDNELRRTNLVAVSEVTEDLTNRALASRPEVSAASQKVAASKQQKKSAEWGQLIPSFGVEHWFGGFTGNRDTFYFVEWNVLDQMGGLLSSRSRAAKARVKQAQLHREQVGDRVAAEVLTARERVLTAGEQITTSQQAVTQAEEALRVSEERLREVVGVLRDSGITVLEVLQAQEALTRARRNFINAVVDYNQAQVGLAHSLGNPSDAMSTQAIPR